LPTDIPSDLRQFIAERARERCEYCLLPQTAVLFKHEPDHIVPRQHGGASNADNLALACTRCNRYKGPNVGSFDPYTGKLTPFFNPRVDNWSTHFQYIDGILQPLTAKARVTAKILRLNDADRVIERIRLSQIGLYKTP
jgi:hypothetical protein